ncbi:uncharacterized protein LOC6638068 [Drosophila willistoni]|uniref:uncharacterized protein LOC6638068 n=1 Tax=Drosophila willistoni TaxID=7260 RepID=UPI00017D64BB|nr:uncharacterized protein LOC6638068 [Drosophila willistoni]
MGDAVTEHLRPLDNCEIFFQLRNALQTYSRNVKNLKTFVYWSGNEEAIKELCDICIEILLEHKLIEIKGTNGGLKKQMTVVPNAEVPGSKDRLRGLMVYLILNSSNVYKCEEEQLGQWNPQCVHLLKQLPYALPQFLTVALVSRCGLVDVFAEFLSCGPIWLTGQYYECLNTTLSHLTKDHYESLNLLCMALLSASRAIRWQKEESTLLSSQLRKLLQRHLLDSEERLRVLRPTGRKLYLGQAITQIMEILIKTLDIKKEDEKQLPSFFPLYQLRLKNKVMSMQTDQQLSSSVQYALILLDFLQNLVQLVSVDTFIHWLELPSKKPLYNVQERICVLSSDLLKLLVKDDNLKLHSICKQLHSFALTAKSFEEKLEELSLGKLLSFLEGEEGEAGEDQIIAGLEQLFLRSIAFGNDECVETMAKHIKVMKFTHAQRIIEHLSQVAQAKEVMKGLEVTDEQETTKKELKDEKDDDEDYQQEYSLLISQVLFPIFEQCSVTERIQILNIRDDLQLLQQFSFDIGDHENQRILFFNQFSLKPQRLPIGEFLQLCFAHPLETWLSLAKLSMAHEGFAKIFWRLACLCSGHVFHYMSSICTNLILDERMLHNQNSQNFLLSIYIYPLILNGLRISSRLRKNCRFIKLRLNLKGVNYPYTLEKLKSCQSDYLDALALSLDKFSDLNTRNYAIICKLMSILMAVSRLDAHLMVTSRNQLTMLNSKKVKDDVKIAKEYTNMHIQLAHWRRSHWPLISQLIQTMDLLRWNLTCYNSTRADALNLVVLYWKESTMHPYLMPKGLIDQIQAVVDTMQHKSFWLVHNMFQIQDSGSVKANVELLTQASASEAKVLMQNALICGNDKAIMAELTLAVLKSGPEIRQSALNGYNFIFKCYIKAFQGSLPQKAKPGVWIRWVEKLLEVVVKSPEEAQINIFHLAHPTLIALYQKSYFNVNVKEKILQYMTLLPQNTITANIIREMENLNNLP